MNQPTSNWGDGTKHLCQGFLMGGADIIPGVSGGTVALVLGIYERLVGSISRFDMTFLSKIKQRQWKLALQYIDVKFLLCLGFGIILGIFSLAGLMHYLLDEYRQFTLAAFFGLISASSILVAKMVERWSKLSLLWLLGCGLTAYWIVGLVPVDVADSYLYFFVCGCIAICAMILPGISGAFILLLLGKYHAITGMLREMLRGNFSLEAISTLAVFILGCLVGLLSFSKCLRWLLTRYHAQTMAGLCGIMIGSLRKVWPFQALDPANQWTNQLPERLTWEVVFCISIAVTTALLVFVTDYYAKRKGRLTRM